MAKISSDENNDAETNIDVSKELTMTQTSRLESPSWMAKPRSDEDNDVNIDEDINREIDIDEDIKNTRDSMAKVCNDN